MMHTFADETMPDALTPDAQCLSTQSPTSTTHCPSSAVQCPSVQICPPDAQCPEQTPHDSKNLTSLAKRKISGVRARFQSWCRYLKERQNSRKPTEVETLTGDIEEELHGQIVEDEIQSCDLELDVESKEEISDCGLCSPKLTRSKRVWAELNLFFESYLPSTSSPCFDQNPANESEDDLDTRWILGSSPFGPEAWLRLVLPAEMLDEKLARVLSGRPIWSIFDSDSLTSSSLDGDNWLMVEEEEELGWTNEEEVWEELSDRGEEPQHQGFDNQELMFEDDWVDLEDENIRRMMS